MENDSNSPTFRVYNDCVPEPCTEISICGVGSIPLNVACIKKFASEVQVHVSVGQTGPTVMICENAFSGDPCTAAVTAIAITIITTAAAIGKILELPITLELNKVLV